MPKYMEGPETLRTRLELAYPKEGTQIMNLIDGWLDDVRRTCHWAGDDVKVLIDTLDAGEI